MGTCKHCKHWESSGKCGNTHILEDDCVIYYADPSTGDIPNKGILIYLSGNDLSGAQTGMFTGPDFGCVNFEEAGKACSD